METRRWSCALGRRLSAEHRSDLQIISDGRCYAGADPETKQIPLRASE
jgi:hypothetical protein